MLSEYGRNWQYFGDYIRIRVDQNNLNFNLVLKYSTAKQLTVNIQS